MTQTNAPQAEIKLMQAVAFISQYCIQTIALYKISVAPVDAKNADFKLLKF